MSKELPKKVEQFLRYEMVRASGYFNMITEAVTAMRYAGLTQDEYLTVLNHYSDYKKISEDYRSESKENEALFTEYATRMATRVREGYQKTLRIEEEVKEIMERALSEPAPF